MSESIHERFLSRALELAKDNATSGRGGPFGAVIARGEEIVVESVNLVTASLDPTAHAELNAIREACRKLGTFTLQACTLYSSCEPCPMCLGAIYWARLGALYFAGTRQDAARAGFDGRQRHVAMLVDVPHADGHDAGLRLGQHLPVVGKA